MNKSIFTLLTITILSGIALSSSPASADTEVIDTVELTVPVACTMGGIGTTSHNASINPGTYSGASGSEYEAGIGKTTLTTFCNDNNGFSVYAIGFTNDLYEGETHTKLIGQNTNQTISTKVYASGDTDSNWSMKVTKVDNPASGDPITYNPDNMSIQNSFNSWHVVPDTYTKVAQYNSNTTDLATTDTTLGAKLETTYATYISSAQAADTYTGQVKYTMVHPYNHSTPDEFTSETLQSVANWGHKVNPGQTVTVKDARDGQEYTVARLADGNLWMTKNLRLNLATANITAENTNNPTSAFLVSASNAQPSNEWCTSSDAACTDQINYNTSNIGKTTLGSDGHTYNEYGVYYNWYTATAGNGTYSTASNTTVSGDICPAGWHLPTGSNTSIGSPNTWTGGYWYLTAALDGGIASDNSNYSTITGATGSTRLRSSPNNFLYSGYFNGSTVSYLGEQGYYWSSTKTPGTYVFILYFNNNSISPGNNNLPAFLGAPIRCVTNTQASPPTEPLAPQSIDTANTLQEVTYCSEDLLENQPFTLTDSRDNTSYHVAKLQDGRCWMLDNLALNPLDNTVLINLNSANTNASNTTLEYFKGITSRNPTIDPNGNFATGRVTSWGNYSYSVPFVVLSDKDVIPSDSLSQAGEYKVGGYYNYCAASAGSYCFGNGNNSGTSSGNAIEDICPRGWRMPTGGTSGEYSIIANAIYGSTEYINDTTASTEFRSALHLPLPGYWSGSYNNRGTSGEWWSSTLYSDNNNMFTLDLFQNQISPSNSRTARWYGLSIRCILNTN